MAVTETLTRGRTISLVACAAIGLLAFATACALPAAAHEQVTVGPYEFRVGWREEPTVVGVVNGLDLGIHWSANGSAVTGAEGALSAELTTGGASATHALEPQFGRPGWYTFDVIPTREGVYSVRISGTLGSTSADVTVNLDPVVPRSDIEFPAADPTPTELERAIDRLASENGALRAQLTTALALAAIGGVVAVAGLVTGALTWRKTRRAS